MPYLEQLKTDFYNAKLGQRVRFVIFFVLNFGNVLSDWLLFDSVAGVKEGLVFGPPGDGVKYALLVFSILGSMAVVPEIWLNWIEIIKDEWKDDIDGCRGALIFFTDIPLMSINLLIVTCSEGATSYYQLGKALVIVVVTFIRLVHVGSEKALKTNEEIKGFVYKQKCTLAQFVLACCLLFASQTSSKGFGSNDTVIKLPHTVFKDAYDDRKYLTNVSIYFNHPYLDYQTNPSRDNMNFIRLLSIYDVKNSKIDRTVNIKYDITHENWLIKTDGQFTECFTKKNGKVTKKAVCSDQFHSPAGQFAFTFHFIGQSWPEFIFGDITYNMRAGNNTNCEAPDFQAENEIYYHIDEPSSAMMRYYHTWHNITEEYHIIQKSNDTYEFYQEKDLFDIESFGLEVLGHTFGAYARALGVSHPTRMKDWESSVCNFSYCMHLLFHTVSFL